MSFCNKKQMGSRTFLLFIVCLAIISFLFLSAACFADSNHWPLFAFEASAAKAQEKLDNTTNNHSVYKLQDEQGQPVFPSSVIRSKNDLFFLGPQCLWWCLGAKTQADGGDILILRQIDPPPVGALSVSWQEANDFVYLPQRQSIAILDKSGDLFEYSLLGAVDKRWRVLRANGSTLGPPDPEYIAACEMNDNICLLDPERNQIWLQTQSSYNLQSLLPGVLAWKLRAGDTSVTDATAIGYLNGQVYVLRKSGLLSKYGVKYGARQGKYHGHFCCPEGQVYFKRPLRIRPSRLYLSADDYIYIVERENNRVLKIGIKQPKCSSFVFPGDCDLRSLVAAGDGFWIINGDNFAYKGKNTEEGLSTRLNPRGLDKRLQDLILPITGQSLPGHPGVYPGARRLYRFGVHAGLDLFNQPGAKVHVMTGTPVRAACAGQIVRTDLAFKDMNYSTYNRVIKECFVAHQTSAKNEDLLRGCQVWIDSGNGLLTKYAHLCRVNSKLRIGTNVRQGETIGYVGVSGTGENLPGRARAPHLHFEIWLDGKYLGYGLNLAETMALYEDIFAYKRK